MDTITPFLMYEVYLNATWFFFNILLHMIAAKAPTGVRSAPRFEPTMAAYTAGCVMAADAFPITGQNNTLIGILFIMLAVRNEAAPYENSGYEHSRSELIFSVTPYLSRVSTITNIEMMKGTISHGTLFMQSFSSFP